MYSLVCFLNYVKMPVTEDIPFTKKNLYMKKAAMIYN